MGQKIDERWVAYFVWKSVGISHTIPDFSAILTKGIAGIGDDIAQRRKEPLTGEQGIVLSAMTDTLSGLSAYSTSLSEKSAAEAAVESDPSRKKELEEISDICLRVPERPAETLHEAVTSVWLTWVALHNENTDTGLSLGRLDQLFQPFFERDYRKLSSDKAREAYIKHAIELIGCLFMRCTDHFPLSPDIGNYLFGGASSTQALTLGGVNSKGEDAVNDMTYIMLKVTEMLSIRDVNVNARFKPGVNSEAYLKRLCEVNVITAGTPSMHNDDAVFESLRGAGYSEEDIRDWSSTGCVEPTLTGQHMGHTGSILMNLVAGLEMALNNGRHPLMRWNLGPKTGQIEEFGDFEAFFDAYKTQQRFLIEQAVTLNAKLAEAHAVLRPTPLLSSLMGGAIENAQDVTRGGARYNTSGTSNIGLADVTDSLLIIKQLVFDDKKITFSELKEALDTNFENHEKIRAIIQNQVNIFGSGDPAALEMANRVAAFVSETYASHTNFRGGKYTTGFWSMSQHVAYGNLSGAIPSGRQQWKAFTPGLTPHPSASKSFLDNIRDVARLNPKSMDNNIAFNVKLMPDAKDSREKTVDTMYSYVKSYFDEGGMQMQFNVVTSDTLKDAMANPDEYRGLLVRISGYNAYFVTLNREIQIELIERAEFGL